MEFNLVQLAISVRTADAVRLASWLPQIGSGFASACRPLVCDSPDRPCENCSRQDSCPWHLLFGQKLSTDPAELKRHQKPPLPFIFSFPAVTINSGPGSELSCGLTVVGSAIPHLELLLEGFTEILAGDSCPVFARVASIGSRDYQGAVQKMGDIQIIRQSSSLNVLSATGLLDARPRDCSVLHMRLLSPLRLFEEGRLLVRFDFSRFARSMMRRVSSLAYYYGEQECDCDFKALSAQAEAVICTEDHFQLQSGGVRKISGITGHGAFQGNLDGLMPFLVLGSYLHAGKGASYGMGMYELMQENEV